MNRARARRALGIAIEQLERWVIETSEREEPVHLANWISVSTALSSAIDAYARLEVQE